MKNFFKNLFNSPPTAAPESNQSIYNSGGSIILGSSVGMSFDGEKTIGELGAPVEIYPEYRSLRLRAYEANLTSDVIKIISSKVFKWAIGNGLTLKSEPLEDYLNIKGLPNKTIDLRNRIEASFSLYASLNNSDYSQMKNFHALALDAYTDSFLGGDCLVIYRIENNYPTAQVIDGQQVCDPFINSEYYRAAEERGHRIKHGVELDRKGKHVAYYVKSEKGLKIEHERIPAFVELNGKHFPFAMAKMIYFGKHRINDVRGVSALSAILEKVNKLDRYTEATVGSAEERAKIVMSITHDKDSTGENPMIERTRANMGLLNPDSGKSGADLVGAELERHVARTTDKTTVNMPNGSKLEALESRAEINYEPLFNAVFTQIAAALDMPPEVALQKFSSNYSASRAAMKIWEYMIKIDRNRFANEFYKPFYDLFFYCEVLRGNLTAQGFINACDNNDFMTIGAYTKSRFEGVNMPHIDPLKEVNAIRKMLGDKWADIPLISLSKATLELNQGDWWTNYSEFEQEINENNLDLSEPINE